MYIAFVNTFERKLQKPYKLYIFLIRINFWIYLSRPFCPPIPLSVCLMPIANIPMAASNTKGLQILHKHCKYRSKDASTVPRTLETCLFFKMNKKLVVCSLLINCSKWMYKIWTRILWAKSIDHAYPRRNKLRKLNKVYELLANFMFGMGLT